LGILSVAGKELIGCVFFLSIKKEGIDKSLPVLSFTAVSHLAFDCHSLIISVIYSTTFTEQSPSKLGTVEKGETNKLRTQSEGAHPM
jgi:hypothetical protein